LSGDFIDMYSKMCVKRAEIRLEVRFKLMICMFLWQKTRTEVFMGKDIDVGSQTQLGQKLQILHARGFNGLWMDFHISLDSNQFVSRILKSNPSERLTVKQILSHPWLKHVSLPNLPIQKPIGRKLMSSSQSLSLPGVQTNQTIKSRRSPRAHRKGEVADT
jgi:serine/threonine protein kinase